MSDAGAPRLYSIVFARKAAKALRALPAHAQRQVQRHIDGLALQPRPHGVEQIKGQVPILYRVRAGSYRIVYQVDDDRVIVLIVRIGDRKDVYRDL